MKNKSGLSEINDSRNSFALNPIPSNSWVIETESAAEAVIKRPDNSDCCF